MLSALRPEAAPWQPQSSTGGGSNGSNGSNGSLNPEAPPWLVSSSTGAGGSSRCGRPEAEEACCSRESDRGSGGAVALGRRHDSAVSLLEQPGAPPATQPLLPPTFAPSAQLGSGTLPRPFWRGPSPPAAPPPQPPPAAQEQVRRMHCSLSRIAGTSRCRGLRMHGEAMAKQPTFMRDKNSPHFGAPACRAAAAWRPQRCQARQRSAPFRGADPCRCAPRPPAPPPSCGSGQSTASPLRSWRPPALQWP